MRENLTSEVLNLWVTTPKGQGKEIETMWFIDNVVERVVRCALEVTKWVASCLGWVGLRVGQVENL